jgi:hypothetical protein
VLALNVKFVTVVKSRAVVALKVNVLEPRVIVLVFELVDNKAVAVTLKLPVLKVPLVTVTLPEQDNALPRVQPPPTPLKTTETKSEVPLVVIVFPVVVELKVIVFVPELDQTVPAKRVIDPAIFIVGPDTLVKVTVPADTVRLRQANAPVKLTV